MPATTARGACATSENALAFASAGVTTGAAGRVRLEATKLSARFGRGSVVDGALPTNPPRTAALCAFFNWASDLPGKTLAIMRG